MVPAISKQQWIDMLISTGKTRAEAEATYAELEADRSKMLEKFFGKADRWAHLQDSRGRIRITERDIRTNSGPQSVVFGAMAEAWDEVNAEKSKGIR